MIIFFKNVNLKKDKKIVEIFQIKGYKQIRQLNTTYNPRQDLLPQGEKMLQRTLLGGTWVAQSVARLTWAQVMISQFMS